MLRRRMMFFLYLSLTVLIGCSRNEGRLEPPGPDVVASFRGGVITKAQLHDKFDRLMPCCKDRYKGEAGRKVLVKEMVLPQVISRVIRGKKIDLRENIRERLGTLTDELNMTFLHMKFHEQILNENENYKALREEYAFNKRRLEGLPLSERYNQLVQLNKSLHPQIAKAVEAVSMAYIEQLHKDASITKHYELLQVQVSGEELRDFYRRHKDGLHGDEYRDPEKAKIQEIVIPIANEEARPTVKERAIQVLTEIRSGAPFQTVSEKPGDVAAASAAPKWIVRGGDESDFEEAVFSLDIGQISDILEKDGAFHIVRVLEKKPGRHKSFEEIVEPLTREYRWQKAGDYLKENRDRILFTINGKPYTIGDFSDAYARTTPPHQCHHMKGMETHAAMPEPDQLCDLSHNDFEEQKRFADRMIDRELITEDTYNQMIHVEHQKEIEFLTMSSLYPIFHQEEMDRLIQINDEMVRRYYEEHKDKYQYPSKAKLNMIVMRGAETAVEKKAAYEKALKAHEELNPSFFSFKRGKDFAEVARKYSEDPETASRGGRLDVDMYECRNEIEYMLLHGFHKQVFSLKPGDTSEVFEFGNDYYIIQIREMERAKQAGFETVKERVRQELMDQHHQKVMESWEEDLLRAAGFTVYDRSIEEVLAEKGGYEEIKKS